jgi:hypothetical protein
MREVGSRGLSGGRAGNLSLRAAAPPHVNSGTQAEEIEELWKRVRGESEREVRDEMQEDD